MKKPTKKRTSRRSPILKEITDRLREVAQSIEQPTVGWQARENENGDVVAQITEKRGSVYGPFLSNAIVAQAIKAALRAIPDPDNEGKHFENLPVDVREGLDLIALKLSRIVCGDPEYLDNWDDIGGYAKIVADRIRGSRA